MLFFIAWILARSDEVRIYINIATGTGANNKIGCVVKKNTSDPVSATQAQICIFYFFLISGTRRSQRPAWKGEF